MQTRQEAIQYCYSFQDVYEDYPFHDDNWCVMRHKGNKKTFALIYDKDGCVWINVKCDPEWREFWRNAFESVIPAYHMNKTHWNSIILDGSVTDKDIRRMIGESYDLTKEKMRILVDADACPVVSIIEKTAKKYDIPVILLCDTNHVLYSDYSEVITVGAGADAVDFKLVSLCQKGDIVVTQDYGVAAMILGKGAYGIHQSGKWYTNENIDQMLMERHLAKKARNAKKKHHLKGPTKRTEEDDKRFEVSLEKLIEKRISQK